MTDPEQAAADQLALEALRERADHLSSLENIPSDWEARLEAVRAKHVERESAGSRASKQSRGRIRLPHSLAQLAAASRIDLEAWD